MGWRELLLRYLWAIGLDEAMRSRRLSVEGKTFFLLGIVPYFAAVVVATEVLWVLTGRGRRLHRLFGGGYIVVMPFRRGLPPELRAQMDAPGAEPPNR